MVTIAVVSLLMLDTRDCYQIVLFDISLNLFETFGEGAVCLMRYAVSFTVAISLTCSVWRKAYRCVQTIYGMVLAVSVPLFCLSGVDLMIQLHHLNHSRSQRILWLLEELELDYELIKHQRDPNTELAPASLKKVHPLGKAPVLIDDELTLAESGAVVDYLAQRYGPQLLPEKDSAAWWDYVFWLHYAEGSLMPPLVMRLVFSKIQAAPVPFFIRPIIKKIVAQVDKAFLHQQIHGQLNFVADHLSCHNWMLGEHFSAADIQMGFPLEAAMYNKKLAASYPRINAYVQQLQARPAYVRALAKGGDYRYGPKTQP